MPLPSAARAAEIRQIVAQAQQQIARVIIGKEAVIELLLIGL
ncbi:MAG: AAA family ATPase, partial [Oscillochloris sp.]|nr:AAA family ATPase [Oscillochloris sp.]